MKSGFTIFEIVIVMGLTFILVGVAGIAGYQSYRAYLFSRTVDQVRQELVAARADTIGGTRDSAWGVAILPTQLVRFAGDTYATRQSLYDVTTTFSGSVTVTGTTQIDFLRPEGNVLASTTITITNGIRTSTINVNTLGRIQKQ